MDILLSKSKVTVLVTFGVLCVLAGTAWAETELLGPATLSNAGEYYRLTTDITTSGTAFTITANDVTLDLDGHTVTYSSGSGIQVSASNVEVKNGSIVQQGDSNSPGIKVSAGSGQELHHLVIRVTGDRARGIDAPSFNNAKLHHNYIEVLGSTSDIAYAPDCVYAEARSPGGIEIYDNILVQGHRGLNLNYVGRYTENPTRSYIHNNLIQPVRTPGTKWPVGIGLAQNRNVHVYDNQVISDDARGLVLDGLGYVTRGTDYVTVYNNRIDVEYIIPAGGGAYPENNVFGLYDRYASGDNTFENNIVIVNNAVDGATAAVRIGSDFTDPLMKGIVVKDNILVARKGSVFLWGVVDEVNVINNKYLGDVFSANNWDANQYGMNIGDEILVSGNTELTLESYTPATPTGLYITKFLNSYLLRWDDNLDKGESQTYEYIVYRDGQKLPISPRGGTFYVDVDVGGTHTYSISALTLSGNEGPRCPEVSTNSAKIGWWGGSPPSPPSILRIITN